MRKFEDYSKAYQTLKMERDGDGILLLTAHTDGGPLRWGALPHEEWPHAFHDIAMDRDNRVVILTGTGDEFSGPRPPAATRYARPVADMDRIVFDGRHLLANLLEIQAPMISAINGPCIRHSEDSAAVRYRARFGHDRHRGCRTFRQRSRSRRWGQPDLPDADGA